VIRQSSTGAPSARTVFGEAWTDGKRAWPQLLATDVAYKLLTFVVLAPLSGLALRAGISLSGNPVLADQDILYFLLRPIGLTVLIVVAALSLTIAALEYACLMTIGLGAAEDARVSAVGALRFVFERARGVVGLAVRYVASCLLHAAPFLAALGLIYFFLLRAFDINYYLAERPPAFMVAVGLAVVLLSGLAWRLVPRLIGWSLALSLVLFENVPAKRALAESERRVCGHRLQIAWLLTLWGAGAALLSLAVPSLVLGLGRLIVPFGKGNVGLVLALMLLLLTSWAAVVLLVAWVNASAFALLSARFYVHLGGGRGEIVSRFRSSEALGSAKRVQLTLGRVLSGLAALALVAGGGGFVLVQGVQGNDDVIVIAHRGASRAAPENTLAAVERAIEQRTDYVEIDVQETADGEIAVIHDSDLMKVAGVDLKIWNATRDDLQAIDIGSWFGAEFGSERVPYLREVLELADGNAKVMIELKYYGHDEDLEQRVVDLVEELGVVDNIVVMSLKYEAVKKVRALRPDWTVGLLTATAVGDLTKLDVDFFAVNTGLATGRFIRRAHARGKDVYIWTVNDPVRMFDMMNFGVDGIITDEPGLARSVIERRAELSSVERLLVGIAFFFGAAAPDPPASVDAG